MSAPSSPERAAAEDTKSESSVGQASVQDIAEPVSQDAELAKPDPDVEDAGSNDDDEEEEEEEEEGEIDEDSAHHPPAEPVHDGPPLPQEQAPPADDDGWDCQWDSNTQAWFFHNRFTGKTQWDNPRVPSSSSANDNPAPTQPAAPQLPTEEAPVSGYNPAIHGDYDPNAWYAQRYNQPDEPSGSSELPSLEDGLTAAAGFNRFTGQFQHEDMGPGRHTDEAKSRRQMNAFFDVDAAANADDGRSLKAERANKRISKSELKAFKEKRRARKEEKRRAWLRD